MKKHWAKIKDADRRNMVGRYSALLIQVKDNRDWSEPVDVALVQKLGSAALVKLIPAWEPQVKPGNLDIDTWSETYGQPVSYQFNEQPIGDEGTYSSPRSVQVHPIASSCFVKAQRMTTSCLASRFLRPATTTCSILRRRKAVAPRGF
jgi:hypothetical protein